MILADTIFLISLYGRDVNTPAAKKLVSSRALPIHVTTVNDFEFSNALRLLVFRGKITPASLRSQISAYETDKAAGRVVQLPCDTNRIFLIAESLSAANTESGGHRAYDILQVAASLDAGAKEFWTFDGRQGSLAQAVGLLVGP
jgi:predicted nucleic acid-binding protein